MCGLELRQSLEIKQKIDQKLTLQEKLELLLSVKTHIEDIRNETSKPPEDILKEIAEKLKNAVGEEYKDLIDLILSSDEVYAFLLQAEDNIIQLEKYLQKIVVNYLYITQKNTAGKMVVENEDGATEALEVDLHQFDKALRNRDETIREIENLDKILKKLEGNVDGTLQERRRLQNALNVTDSLRDNVADVKLLLQYVLTTEYQEGESIMSFLNDHYILQKLDFIISERLLNRFSSAFMARSINSAKPESFKNAFSNAVGEFSLMSMGIIDPDIFVLQKADIPNNVQEKLRVELKNEGVDFDAMVKKYNLAQGRQIFWHRFNTLDKKPTRLTDDLIRNFITKTVRADINEIYEAVDFESFFNDMKSSFSDEEVGNLGTQEERKREKKDFFMRRCSELFASDHMQKKIIELITSKWSKEMAIFYE